MKAFRSVATAIVLFLAATAVVNARTWTEASSGRTLEGEFVKVEDGKVAIRRTDGRVLKVPIELLSAADQAFVKAPTTAPSAPAPTPGTPNAGGAGDAGPLEMIPSPVTVEGADVKGEGDDRKAPLEVKNTGDRGIGYMDLMRVYLRADGSVSNSDRLQYDVSIARRKTSVADTRFNKFREDDIVRVEGVARFIRFDDGSTWPPMPASPPAKHGDDPVSAKVTGLTGTGKQAWPIIACFNYGPKPVDFIQLNLFYLDAAGEVLKTAPTDASGDALMEPGKGCVFHGCGQDIKVFPPENTATARVKVRRVMFKDGTEWRP